MIIINGEPLKVSELKLVDYLEKEGLKSGRIAIEVNEEILPKAQYGNCVLNDGDVVEIVRFVSGG